MNELKEEVNNEVNKEVKETSKSKYLIIFITSYAIVKIAGLIGFCCAFLS